MIISDDQYQEHYEYCKEFIDQICIYRCRPGEYLLGKDPSKKYTWQFYLRKGLFNAYFMECISDIFIYTIEREIGHFNFQIAGLETASTPMLVGIPLRARKYGININAFSIRKEQKNYGLMNWTEGIVDPNYPVLLVDDLCNSANSLMRAYDIVSYLNMKVMDYCFTLVNKTNRKDSDKIEVDKYFRHYGVTDMNFLHPYTLDDFGLDIPVGGDVYMFQKNEATN